MNEGLYVTIEADDSRYQAAMNRVQSATKQTASQIEMAMEAVQIALGPEMVQAAESAGYSLEKLGEVLLKIKSKGLSLDDSLDALKQALGELGVQAEQTSARVQTASSGTSGGFSRVGMGAKMFLASLAASAVQQFAQMAVQALGDVTSWAQSTGNSFGACMSEVQAAASGMRNQLGAAFASILQTIAPIIMQIISWISALADALGQFFAALGGRGTYIRAKKNFGAVGAAVGGVGAAAAGANKELKKTLLAFDELNQMQDNSSSGGGGGGGGGGGAGGIGDLFEEVPIATDGILGMLNRIASALGPIIGDILGGVAELVNGTMDLISEEIDFFTAYFNDDLKGMEEAVKEMQKTITANDVINWIWTAYHKVGHWFDVAIIDIKLGIAKAVQWALTNFGDVLAVLFPGIGLVKDYLLETLDDTIEGLEEERDATDEALQSWIDFGNSDISLYQIQWQLQLTKNHADYLNKSLTGLDRLQFHAESVKVGLDLVKAKLDADTSAAGGTKGSLKILNDYSPGFIGSRNGLVNLGNQADTASWKVSSLKNTLNNLNGMTVRAGITVGAALINSLHAYGFAEGGHPDVGQLFIARESGPELVGTMGGTPTVANNADIIAGIEAGVYNAMMRADGGGSGGSTTTEVNVFMDNEVVARAALRGQNSLNRRYNLTAKAY